MRCRNGEQKSCGLSNDWRFYELNDLPRTQTIHGEIMAEEQASRAGNIEQNQLSSTVSRSSSANLKGVKRMNTKILISAALAAALALPIAAGSTVAHAEGENEKCYGVAAAGKNDCQTATSSCAGTATQDNQADAWIFVPSGTCEKIAGGVIQES